MEEINYIEKYEKIKKFFDKYLKSNYDFRKTKIKHKYEHTYRVVDIAEHIAKDLDLNAEDIFIAKIIALFHDFGRFEQIKIYDTFSDIKSIDHGKLSIDMLFKEGLIREVLDDIKYDNIIKEAILNHNKYEIETKRLSEQELMHVKIIRDADKTDALYIYATKDIFNSNEYNKEEIENSVISDQIYEDFMDEKTVLNTDMKTAGDKWMSGVAFVFGYYFTSGIKIVRDNNYINIIKERIEIKNEEEVNKINNMFILAENYINYRILNNINF